MGALTDMEPGRYSGSNQTYRSQQVPWRECRMPCMTCARGRLLRAEPIERNAASVSM